MSLRLTPCPATHPPALLTTTAGAEAGFHPFVNQKDPRNATCWPATLGAQVTVQMLDWADLVLAMDSAVLAELRALAGNRARPELRLYAEGRDVPDPWGKDADAFTACAQLIEEAARRQAR